MAIEYRMILKATFGSAEEREKAIEEYKKETANASKKAVFRAAHIIRDEYEIPDVEGERIV
jgi:hypothetical protein